GSAGGSHPDRADAAVRQHLRDPLGHRAGDHLRAHGPLRARGGMGPPAQAPALAGEPVGGRGPGAHDGPVELGARRAGGPGRPVTDVDGLALQLAGVTRRFSGLTAVSEVSLRVAPGARHGIIGPNGAGKTTLFNVISGELPATSGSITLFDRDITRLSPFRRVSLGLGRTYQITRTFTHLTV